MARFIRMVGGYNQPVAVHWRVAANNTINEGDLVEIDATSRYIKPASASSTTICGIAMESITTGAQVTPDDKILVMPVQNAVIRMNYTGTTKPSLADTDLVSTKFNLSDARTINLDNTSNGMCSVVGYNNTRKTADVIIADANIAKIG